MRIPRVEWLNWKTKRQTIGATLRKGGEDHHFTEQFKALRSKIEYKADMLNVKIIAVTSAIAGEGKSMVSACLAMNLASGGRKRVLLVDVDMRKSDLARGLSLGPLPGLSELMAGSVGLDAAVRTSEVPGLHVIPAGSAVSAPADILSGDGFQRFLSQAREQYDLVILDTPPILPVADTLSLRERVDAFIVVFRAGYTPHAMLKQAVDEIGEKKIIGVVLNGLDPPKEKYYAKYYGNYYRKGGEEGKRG